MCVHLWTSIICVAYYHCLNPCICCNSSAVHCAKYLLFKTITQCTEINSIIESYNYICVWRTCCFINTQPVGDCVMCMSIYVEQMHGQNTNHCLERFKITICNHIFVDSGNSLWWQGLWFLAMLVACNLAVICWEV